MSEPSMRGETERRRALRDALLNSLRNDELVLYHQPQVDLETGRIFGTEALIRWHRPTRGLLLPGIFLPALDQNALALDVGWWTLDEACRQAARLAELGHGHIKIGINLFPAQLRAPNLSMRVSEAIKRHGIKPSALELEVTETIALHDNDKALDVLTNLRQIGGGIAFDDFGTGFASPSSLQRHPLSTLKIDRGFISNIMTTPRDAAITRALISMSRELGLNTIAEGIETQEQEVMLVALGCPSADGISIWSPHAGSSVRESLIAEIGFADAPTKDCALTS